MKKNLLKYIILFGIIIGPHIAKSQGYYNRYEYRRKRHEINFGGGASSCLTDLGGRDAIGSGFLWDIDIAKTSYVANFSYLYNIRSKIAFKLSLSYLNISGDDAFAGDYYRNNRRLNFETSIIETAAICELTLITARTGSRYNLRSPGGRYLKKQSPMGIGLYVFSGIGGFYFNPTGKDRFIDENGTVIGSGIKYKLRDLHTEGQGMPDDPANFAPGTTYSPFALCVPVGFGFKKSFNSIGGIKVEAGYRFTNTDYLDDVSNVYYDRTKLGDQYGNAAAIMSGTETGRNFTYIGYALDGNYPNGATPEPTLDGTNPYSMIKTHTAPGFQRGNPKNDDNYMFVTVSAYKKFTNSSRNNYKTISVRQKRKVKASF